MNCNSFKRMELNQNSLGWQTQNGKHDESKWDARIAQVSIESPAVPKALTTGRYLD